MIYYHKILISMGLLISSTIAYAQESQNIELTGLLRQIEQMQDVVTRASTQPLTVNTRYHFDYLRLNNDLTKMRVGIEHYLTPRRAQPRDMTELVGEYQQQYKPNWSAK